MQELTPAEADDQIRASWPARSGSALRLVQPIAAEALTEVDELPASSEYDFPRVPRSRAFAPFWGLYLAGALVAVCYLIARFLPA